MRMSLVPELSRLVSALLAVGLVAGTGCRGSGPSVEDDKSALSFNNRPGEECCQRQFPRGKRRNECLDEARHGRCVRECEPRRDGGMADRNKNIPDASAKDARPDLAGNVPDAAAKDAAVASCGDGVIEPGEDCDPPNPTPDGRILCDNTCHFIGTCGNGQLDPGEQCDPPNPGLCGNNCQFGAVCGDGIIGPGEQCDPPHQGPDGLQCGSNCQFLTCGNGVIDPGEQCDPPRSTANGPAIPVCPQNCQFSTTCGNGVLDPGETCDFPNTVICANCQPTNCAVCFSFSDPCQGLTGPALISCHDLLNCLLGTDAACFFLGGGGQPNSTNTACYCSDATCSAGVNGACASAFNTVAGTTDQAAVVGLLNDPTSLLSQARNVAKRLASNPSCDMFCHI